jgi:hypothetical protein
MLETFELCRPPSAPQRVVVNACEVVSIEERELNVAGRGKVPVAILSMEGERKFTVLDLDRDVAKRLVDAAQKALEAGLARHEEDEEIDPETRYTITSPED